MASCPLATIDCARALAFAWVRPTIAIRAPASASPSAIAPASTPPPPMTTATSPSREKSPLSAMKTYGNSAAADPVANRPIAEARIVRELRPVALTDYGFRQMRLIDASGVLGEVVAGQRRRGPVANCRLTDYRFRQVRLIDAPRVLGQVVAGQ